MAPLCDSSDFEVKRALRDLPRWIYVSLSQVDKGRVKDLMVTNIRFHTLISSVTTLLHYWFVMASHRDYIKCIDDIK